MKTNSKSCLLDAVVMVSWGTKHREKRRDELIQKIGHDGSERGFHTQEIQDAIESLWFLTFVRHELYPCLQLPGGKVIPVLSKEEAVSRFEKKLENVIEYGVLICRQPNGVHHAYQISDFQIRDLDDKVVDVGDLDIVMALQTIYLDY